MNVTYTPPLMDQIRSRGSRVVIVKVRDKYVPAVDPRTRQATNKAQQFRMSKSGELQPLSQMEWVIHPAVVEVSWVGYH